MRELRQEVVVVDLDDASLQGDLTQALVDRWLENEQASASGLSGADTSRVLVKVSLEHPKAPEVGADDDVVPEATPDNEASAWKADDQGAASAASEPVLEPLTSEQLSQRLEVISRSAQLKRVLVLVAGRSETADAWFTSVEHPSLALLWAPRMLGSWWGGDKLSPPNPIMGNVEANLASLLQLLTDASSFDAVWERTKAAPCGGMATPGMRMITLDGRIPTDQLLRQSIGDLIEPTVKSSTGDASLVSGLPKSLLGGESGGGSLNPNSDIAIAIAEGEERSVELSNHVAGWSLMSAFGSRSFVAQTRDALTDVSASAQRAYRTAEELFAVVDASDGLQPEEREKIERQNLTIRVAPDRRAEAEAAPISLAEMVSGTARRSGGLAALTQDLAWIAKASLPLSAEETKQRLQAKVDSGRIGEAKGYARQSLSVPTIMLFVAFAILGLIVDFLDAGGPALGLLGLAGLLPGIVLLFAGPWGDKGSSAISGNTPAAVAALLGALAGAVVGAGFGVATANAELLPVAVVVAVIGGVVASMLAIHASVDRWVSRVPSAQLSSLFGEVTRQVNITKTGQWTYANERLALHRTATSLIRVISAFTARLGEIDYQSVDATTLGQESGALVSPQEQAAGGEAIKVGLVKAVRQALGSLLADRLNALSLAQRSGEVSEEEAEKEARALADQVVEFGHALDTSGVFGATRHTLAEVTLDEVGEEFWKHDAQVREMLESSSIRESLFHFVGGADVQWLAGDGMNPVMFMAPRGSVLPEPRGEYIERVQTGRRDLAGLVRLVPVAPPVS